MRVEKAFLACLIENEDDRKIIPQVKEEFFQDDNHKIIFSAIEKMWHQSSNIDSVLLSQYIRHNNRINVSTELNEICDHYHIENLIFMQEYFDILKNRFSKRKIMQISNSMKVMLKDEKTPEEIATYCEEQLIQIFRESKSDVMSMGKVNNNLIETLNRRMSNTEPYGLNTGYHDLDKILGGIGSEELVVIAARPGLGKTSFACNMAVNMCKQGHRGIMFTYEMSPMSLSERMLSSLSDVPFEKLKRGQISGDSFKIVMDSMAKLSEINLWYDDSFPNIDEMKAKIINYIHKYQIDYILIDYLQLITLPDGKKAWGKVDEVARITRALVKMAMKYKVPVILLSQMSRGIESRENKRPVLSDLRDSGTIEQDAHKVVFLWTEKADYDKQDWEMNVFVAKNRNGDTGEAHYTFNRPTLTYR